VNGTPDANQQLRRHPGWWARLEGEEFDLEALAGALGDRSPVQIRQFDGRYYLRMAELDELTDSGDVETRAGEVLRTVNGAARVQYGDNREVQVDAAARGSPKRADSALRPPELRDPRTQSRLGHAHRQRGVSSRRRRRRPSQSGPWPRR
jgi:hypothetical protein